MEYRVLLFDEPGPQNTKECAVLVKELVAQGVSRYVVVASTRGDTAREFATALSPDNSELVIVTHSVGFSEPGVWEFDRSLADDLTAAGVKVLPLTVLTHSLEKAFVDKYSGAYPTQIVAESLRRWGQGAKVACEIVMQAVDSGVVPEGENVLAMGGTVRGADTVMLIRAAASKRFLELKVLRTFAHPNNF